MDGDSGWESGGAHHIVPGTRSSPAELHDPLRAPDSDIDSDDDSEHGDDGGSGGSPASRSGVFLGWAKLSEEECWAVRTLGWTAESWDAALDFAPFEHAWHSLGPESQRAAHLLGMVEADFVGPPASAPAPTICTATNGAPPPAGSIVSGAAVARGGVGPASPPPEQAQEGQGCGGPGRPGMSELERELRAERLSPLRERAAGAGVAVCRHHLREQVVQMLLAHYDDGRAATTAAGAEQEAQAHNAAVPAAAAVAGAVVGTAKEVETLASHQPSCTKSVSQSMLAEPEPGPGPGPEPGPEPEPEPELEPEPGLQPQPAVSRMAGSGGSSAESATDANAEMARTQISLATALTPRRDEAVQAGSTAGERAEAIKAKPAQERTAGSEAEAQLAQERTARSEAEAQLAQERTARSEAEARLAQERTARSEAEAQLAQERTAA
jgi:hypothetical protein